MIIKTLWLPAAMYFALMANCYAETVIPLSTDLSNQKCPQAPDMRYPWHADFDSTKPFAMGILAPPSMACWSAPEGRVHYTLISLPQNVSPYSIMVESRLINGVMIYPHVRVLDTAGNVIREFSGDRITLRTGGLTAFFRAHSEDKYLLISSDPAYVGKNVIETFQDSTFLGGLGIYREGTRTYTFSHSGKLRVVLWPIATELGD